MVEADFVRYYNRDLAEVVKREGLRRLSVLVFGLPMKAMIWHEEMQWTVENELAALNVEVLDRLRHDVIMVATGKRIGEPLEIDRPDSVKEAAQPKKKEIITDPGEIRAFFQKNL